MVVVDGMTEIAGALVRRLRKSGLPSLAALGVTAGEAGPVANMGLVTAGEVGPVANMGPVRADRQVESEVINSTEAGILAADGQMIRREATEVAGKVRKSGGRTTSATRHIRMMQPLLVRRKLMNMAGCRDTIH